MQRSLYLVLSAGLCALPGVALGQYTETENNDTKATANAIAAMASGETLTGSSTGTSTTAAGGLTSVDYWRIQTVAAPLGIYRHVLTLNNTAFVSGIRTGVNQNGAAADTLAGAPWDGVVGTAGTTETAVQTSSGTPEINAWYGFGKSETTVLRITGTTSTTAPYVLTLATTPVTPTDLGTFAQGQISISPLVSGTTTDTDFWVYDGTFTPILGSGNDDEDVLGGSPGTGSSLAGYLARTYAPGRYYLAMSNWNLATNRASPSDDGYRTGTMLDVADVALNSSSTATAVNLNFTMADSAGRTAPVSASRTEVFGILWYTFEVATPTQPTNPSIAGSFSPNFTIPGGSVTVTATVTPGLNPTSSALSVTADSSSVGGSRSGLLDDGVAPDAVAGDNIFSGSVTVSATTLPGSFPIIFDVIDGESRTGTSTTNLTVRPAPSANDNCANATAISSLPYTSPASFIAGNAAALDSAAMCSTGAYDVWYTYTATTSGTHRISTDIGLATGNNVNDTVIAVYDACGGTRLACDDDSGLGLQSQLDFVMTAGTTYYIQAAKYGTGAPANADSLGIFMNVLSTPPTATVTLSPNSGTEGSSFDVFMNVTPGTQPDSTGISARIDLANVGGTNISLADDGIAPDVAAGDNIFSGSGSVAAGTALGSRTLAWSVADDQGRESTGNATFQVLAIPTGACCLGGDVCQVITEAACTSAGGTYLGNNATCFSAGTYSTGASSGGAFEDISITGTQLTQGDDTSVNAPIGFNFEFYGTVYTTLNVCSNGFIQFDGTSTAFTNTAIPAAAAPNNAIYPLWNDYNFTTGGQCYVQTLGTAGVDQRMIVQWNGVPRYGQTDANTFQAALFENGAIEFRYSTITPMTDTDATVGIENADGTVALSFPASTALSASSFRIDYAPGTPNCGPSCSWAADGCFADYDNSGGIDGDDVIFFFADWDAAGECADVDASGGVDGDDVISFFSAWDAGGIGYPGCE